MAALALGILPPALLERDDLGAALLLDDGAGDRGAGDRGRAELRRAIPGQHQHLAERDALAGLAGQRHDGDRLVGGDAILCPARLDECIHRLQRVLITCYISALPSLGWELYQQSA